MGCCSITRFCWYFFVNESSQKIVVNTDRRRDRRTKKKRAKFHKTNHYQPEFNGAERELQDRVGVTASHVVHFARILRQVANDYVPMEDGGIIYRIFVDRRWDTLPGIVEARRKHKVSYTATVMKTHRFHVIAGKKAKKGQEKVLGLKDFVPKSKVCD